MTRIWTHPYIFYVCGTNGWKLNIYIPTVFGVTVHLNESQKPASFKILHSFYYPQPDHQFSATAEGLADIKNSSSSFCPILFSAGFTFARALRQPEIQGPSVKIASHCMTLVGCRAAFGINIGLMPKWILRMLFSTGPSFQMIIKRSCK